MKSLEQQLARLQSMKVLMTSIVRLQAKKDYFADKQRAWPFQTGHIAGRAVKKNVNAVAK